MSNVKEVTTETFEKEVLSSDVPVLVDFWAEWCGPCKSLSPILEEIASELGEKIKVTKANLDENQDLASKFSIRSIPTMLFFKNGKLIDQKVGLLPKSDLLEWIKSNS